MDHLRDPSLCASVPHLSGGPPLCLSPPFSGVLVSQGVCVSGVPSARGLLAVLRPLLCAWQPRPLSRPPPFSGPVLPTCIRGRRVHFLPCPFPPSWQLSWRPIPSAWGGGPRGAALCRTVGAALTKVPGRHMFTGAIPSHAAERGWMRSSCSMRAEDKVQWHLSPSPLL